MKSFRYIIAALAVALIACSCCKQDTGKSDKTPKVDIGMVVNGKKVIWAQCNLGAGNPWEYGDLYAWGELEPKGSYTKETQVYKDIPKTLPLSADAAHKVLGGKWRMPTKAEYEALLALEANDDYIFEKMGTIKDNSGNDVNGLKITRKSTGQVLFFPAAGDGDGEGRKDAERMGRYWTSSYAFTADYQEAQVFAFSKDYTHVGDVATFLGNSIRAVRNE